MTIEYRGYRLNVDYNFYPAEMATWEYPGSPAEVELLSIELEDIDIMELLDQNQLYDIENIIEQNHE